MNKQEIELLSGGIEMLMAERTRLLKVVGAAENRGLSTIPFT